MDFLTKIHRTISKQSLALSKTCGKVTPTPHVASYSKRTSNVSYSHCMLVGTRKLIHRCSTSALLDQCSCPISFCAHYLQYKRDFLVKIRSMICLEDNCSTSAFPDAVRALLSLFVLVIYNTTGFSCEMIKSIVYLCLSICTIAGI